MQNPRNSSFEPSLIQAIDNEKDGLIAVITAVPEPGSAVLAMIGGTLAVVVWLDLSG